MSGRYHFSYSSEGPYGSIVRLLERRAADSGLIVDLGCGYGAVAEPIQDLGYEYVGADLDSDALDALSDRGFETHPCDLRLTADLDDWLVKVIAERPVAAILMLDTLEHLADPDNTLAALWRASVKLQSPLLGLSIPNVGHFDVGAKLAMGRWDVRPTGLLDSTHLQFFTDERLSETLARSGWAELDRLDFHLHHSDQHFPVEHPALADGTPLRNLLWRLRNRVGNGTTVNQFVRLYTPLGHQRTGFNRPVADLEPTHFLSVLVRTQGRRMESLEEALTCLAAQDDDLEVRLLVHTSSQEIMTGVRNLVETFAPVFASRVRVHQVSDGGRARPLNVGLQEARGRYIAFLDDDDLVTKNWMVEFREGASLSPGRLIRSVAVDRHVRRLDDSPLGAPYISLSGIEVAHKPTFDFLEHLSRNRTPICSFAVPEEAVRGIGIRFDEELIVLEDWKFLMELAMVCGVHDTRRVTSIYHRWAGEESSLGSVGRAVWDTTRAAILQGFDSGPLLVPPLTATRLAELWELSLKCQMQLESAEPSEPPEAEPEVELRRQVVDATSLANQMRQQYEEILHSRTWRATYPIRRAGTSLRTMLRRPKR